MNDKKDFDETFSACRKASTEAENAILVQNGWTSDEFYDHMRNENNISREKRNGAEPWWLVCLRKFSNFASFLYLRGGWHFHWKPKNKTPSTDEQS